MGNGLVIEDLVIGEGNEAQDFNKVVVNYTGTLEDGSIFDSSLKPGRTPFTITLGVGSVITSWTNGDSIQNLTPGTYTYTVSSSGCFTSGSVTITNACNANFISNYNVCDESINLSATMNMTNPGSSYNYN